MVRGGWRGKTMYQVVPDENLAKIIGNKPQVTSEVIKNLWNYIRGTKQKDGSFIGGHCKMNKIKID